MSNAGESRAPLANQLLAALPTKEFERLRLKLTQVPLNLSNVLYEPGEIIRKIYFPLSGIVSLLSGAEGHPAFEVGVVGKEGIVGLPVFLGVKTSHNRAVVRGEGSALTLTAAALCSECELGSSLSCELLRYAHSLITQISQAAACSRYHTLDARLSRWLLMTHDRLEVNEFKLTQEFLSEILGVSREGVNRAAGDLQRRKLIGYSRGTLTILDRSGLEATACHCYRTIRDERTSFPVH